ncbi:MAG: bifunctional glutamate N-acetyltransferase/amino-acid acetyltransferase ArgJ [Candidatus Kuenenia sp.]|nr:bifunctional glutamate N-acetyltransferase/amino-acid acetyltransferase ArgJ [Candidatus Kuenenia hertensis]
MKENTPESLEEIPSGSVVTPKEFQASGIYCGLKTTKNRPDIGVIFSKIPAAGAALFTTNKICAAPVVLGKKIIKQGKLRAIIVNSGNANACTGERGYKNAEEMALTASKLLEISEEEILVSSTGVIGKHLPMDKISAGIEQASRSLGNTAAHGNAIAQAIMTTDTLPKSIAIKVKTSGNEILIGGISKGSGMISPNLATMLCFLTTDVRISAELLQTCLKSSADQSFNRITIDGHMSTNDTIAILANGASGVEITSAGTKLTLFQEGLDYVTRYLAKAIVMDGEGATKFIQIFVKGAKSFADATKIARTIADSPLVKTAMNGSDPNWGRIVSAAGYAGVELDEAHTTLYINNILVYEKGMPASFDYGVLKTSMQKQDIFICLQIGTGNYSDTIWTCDLSKEYISINADYHT